MNLLYIIFILTVIVAVTTHGAFAYSVSTPWKVIIESDHMKANSTKFWPPEIQARINDTITWINNDTTAHTVTSGVTNHLNYTGKIFDSGILNPGDTFSFKIPQEKWSAYYYFCKIHPWITGKIDAGDAYLQQSPLSTIYTDRNTYHTNEIIKMFGSVNNTYQIMPITIQIFDELRNPVFLNQTDLLKDHSFSYEMNITKDIFKSSGNYKIKAFYGFPATVVDTNIIVQNESTSSISQHIPKWLKKVVSWWIDSQITDEEFTNNVVYLAKSGYISIPSKTVVESGHISIPIWVRNDATNWVRNTITDEEFAPSIQYLINYKIT